MATTVNLSVEHLRRLCMVAQQTIATIPAESQAKSQRRGEEIAVRSTSGGGGRERAEILRRLSIHSAVAAGQCTFLVSGVADLMETASRRADGLNTAATAVVVRSALEVASQVAWLLDTQIRPDERCRRFLAWRLEDLKQLRKNTASGGAPQAARDAAQASCDASEEAVLASINAAGWQAKPHVIRPSGGIAPAVLLDSNGNHCECPGYASLVTALTGPGVYSTLSVSAHGLHHGTLAATTIDPDTGNAIMTGSVHEPASLIRWAILAAAVPTLRLSSWNGVDYTKLRQATSPT